MSTTTFPVSGTFGGRKSQPVRRAPARPATPVVSTPATTKRPSWTHFLGNAMATWASAGRMISHE